MRVLIVGGTGFVGRHLARACQEGGDSVTVSGRARADVRDAAALRALVREARPERVYHLAGYSNPARSLGSEREVVETNVIGTLNLLEAVEAEAPAARVLYVGSVEEYGRVSEERQPIREDEPLRPVTPYGVSRASASLVAQQFALARRLFVVRTRSYNHTGPGQPLDYAAPSFADQLARARAAGQETATIRVGDLSVRRDFSGVTGVVRAYRGLLERGTSGEVYNVCSGRAVTLGALLERLGELAGVRPLPERDPSRARRVDLPVIEGDPSRLVAATGVSLADSLGPDLEGLVAEARARHAC